MGVGGGRVHICSDNNGKNTAEAKKKKKKKFVLLLFCFSPILVLVLFYALDCIQI